MNVSVEQTARATVVSLGSAWQTAEVRAAIADHGGPVRSAVVFDVARAGADVERLQVEWNVEWIAFVVRDDRMAEAVARFGGESRATVRACESVAEALGWIERMQDDRERAPSAPACEPPVREDKPIPVAWPTRLCSRDVLASAVAVLRALQAEVTEGDATAQVQPAGEPQHFAAFERHAGLLPADVRAVLSLTTGFWSEPGALQLDVVAHSPETFEFGATRLLVVDRATEGLTLGLDPEVCRLWWIEHDGRSLTLLGRGVDAWVVRCATLALREREFSQRFDDMRAMGLALPSAPRSLANASDLSLAASSVVEVRTRVAPGSPAHAWLVALPDSAQVYDFRQAAPGTQVDGLWSDGEWSCHGELWAVT